MQLAQILLPVGIGRILRRERHNGQAGADFISSTAGITLSQPIEPRLAVADRKIALPWRLSRRLRRQLAHDLERLPVRRERTGEIPLSAQRLADIALNPRPPLL